MPRIRAMCLEYRRADLSLPLLLQLWASKVNASGGIPLLDRNQNVLVGPDGKDVRFFVQLDIRNDGSEAGLHAQQVNDLLQQPNKVDFLLGGAHPHIHAVHN